MQFSIAVVASAAFTLANAAQFTMPPQSFVGITAGTPVNITWSDASGPVTILLKNGIATDLKTVETITSGQTGTSFSWTPSTSLTDDTYALEIDDSGEPNYSVQFALTGGAASSSVTSGSSTASSTGSSTASSTGSSASTTGSSSASSSTGSATTTSGSSSTASSGSSTGTASSTSGSSSRTSSSTSTSASATQTTAAPQNTNGAGSIASPLAFVLLAFAALITLN